MKRLPKPRKFKKRQRRAMRPLRAPQVGCHVRCRRCEARRTLAKPISEYVRLPGCRRCGSVDYRVDRYRIAREVGAGAPRPCRCMEYHFPHFKGRGMCIHNPHVTEEYMAQRGRA